MSTSHLSNHVRSATSKCLPQLVNSGAPIPPSLLLQRHHLPLAAHLQMPSGPAGLDLSRPLLLYKSYSSVKVRAVSLAAHKDAMVPVGPMIMIPDTYTGWFAILEEDGLSVPFFATIEQVATNQVPFFLSRYDVTAYVMSQESGGSGNCTYQKTVVTGGHVLKLLGIFEDVNSKKSGTSVETKGNLVTPSPDKYAQCLNYKNEVIFVPFTANGRFYATAHKSSRNTNCVYLMSHILKNHKLPVTVRLVCGYMPRVPCSFTGILRLEKSQKESVILACIMTPEANATLFEIDVASSFTLTPVTDSTFIKSPIFLKTVSYCDDEADIWRRQIKVTHHVTQGSHRPMGFVPLPRPIGFFVLSNSDKKPKKSSKKEIKSDMILFKEASNASQKSQEQQQKLAKQNTYILQNGRAKPSPEVTPKSIENAEYSRVFDDISPSENQEENYAEICELATHSSLRYEDHFSRKLNKPVDPKCHSFTLLNKDLGVYYMKMTDAPTVKSKATAPGQAHFPDSMC